ncbi:hypothetical protein [Demequina sp. NBRC 110052]|uniref:hypothetical protein n=1 Tax=Demequina sp. NBRC 110052 TaxID=1570341 RepID=UPI000A064D2D|nr:hypothetical protein [Demequina sp. NBRC 110052]
MTESDAPGRLVLRLPGTWVQLDPRRREETARRIRRYVELAVGRDDDRVQVRAGLRHALAATMDVAGEDLQSMLLCHEIAPGAPTALSLSVLVPRDVRISPAVGTDPQAVIAGFLEAMQRIGDGEGWEQIPVSDGAAVRRWRVGEVALVPDDADTVVRQVSVDVWRTVPESKRLILVHADSVLADIPHTVVRLVDAIVGSSRVAPQPVAHMADVGLS